MPRKKGTKVQDYKSIFHLRIFHSLQTNPSKYKIFVPLEHVIDLQPDLLDPGSTFLEDA